MKLNKVQPAVDLIRNSVLSHFVPEILCVGQDSTTAAEKGPEATKGVTDSDIFQDKPGGVRHPSPGGLKRRSAAKQARKERKTAGDSRGIIDSFIYINCRRYINTERVTERHNRKKVKRRLIYEVVKIFCAHFGKIHREPGTSRNRIDSGQGRKQNIKTDGINNERGPEAARTTESTTSSSGTNFAGLKFVDQVHNCNFGVTKIFRSAGNKAEELNFTHN